MIKEAIDKILSLAPSTTMTVDGRTYRDGDLHAVKTPQPAPLQVSTLSALVDLIEAQFEKDNINYEPKAAAGTVIVHVVDFGHVQLIRKESNVWAERACYVEVKLPDAPGFQFGQFLNHQAFVIGLLAGFSPTADREELVKLASNLTNERVTTSDDDGITQQVAVRQGAVLKGQASVKGRVSLAPFRTFREIPQPSSEFVFRVQQQGDEIPKCALFEADGGKWKIDAVEGVSRHLRAALKEMVVVA